MRELEEELEKAKELLIIQANLGEQTRTESAPVVPITVEEQAQREEPVADTTPGKEEEWQKEREKLKAELAAQTALREKERQTRKMDEEEK